MVVTSTCRSVVWLKPRSGRSDSEYFDRAALLAVDHQRRVGHPAIVSRRHGGGHHHLVSGEQRGELRAGDDGRFVGAGVGLERDPAHREIGIVAVGIGDQVTCRRLAVRLPHRLHGGVQHAADGVLIVSRVEVEHRPLAPDLEQRVPRHHQRDAQHECDGELASELHDPDARTRRSCCTRGGVCICAGRWRQTSLARRSGAALAAVRQRSRHRFSSSRAHHLDARSSCGRMVAVGPGRCRSRSRRHPQQATLAPPIAQREPAPPSGVGTPYHAKCNDPARAPDPRAPGRRRDPRHQPADARGGAAGSTAPAPREGAQVHRPGATPGGGRIPQLHLRHHPRGRGPGSGGAGRRRAPRQRGTRRDAGWARSPTSHASPSRWTRRRRSTRRRAARSARC